MPLSNDFANSRLEYLKSNIKNNDTVSAQFYPRFQRQYNEMFPFTEGTNKIENPQQPVVSSSLNPPSLEMAKENLKTYLIPYVGSNTEANFIINALTDVQIFYYEEHFNEIQKELLKRIKIPTSKSSYLTNLRMVLNSDKNKNNLSIFSAEPPVISSTFQTPAINGSSRRRKIKIETPSNSSAAENSDSNSHNKNNTFPSSWWENDNIPIRCPTVKTEPFGRSLAGDFNQTRTGLRSDFFLDRQWLQRQTAPGTIQSAPRTLPPLILSRAAATTRSTAAAVTARNTKRYSKAKVAPMSDSEEGGFGLRKTKIFRGRGIQSREIKHKKEFHKYAIDLKKLHHNILALKYLKNANNVATFNPIEISDTLKDLLENFLYDGEQIDASNFEKLSHTEKRILKRLYSFLRIDFDFDYEDQFQKRFEVMYGSFLAGNDNHQLKEELKKYVRLAIHEAIISKQEGLSMMHKLEK